MPATWRGGPPGPPAADNGSDASSADEDVETEPEGSRMVATEGLVANFSCRRRAVRRKAARCTRATGERHSRATRHVLGWAFMRMRTVAIVRGARARQLCAAIEISMSRCQRAMMRLGMRMALSTWMWAARCSRALETSRRRQQLRAAGHAHCGRHIPWHRWVAFSAFACYEFETGDAWLISDVSIRCHSHPHTRVIWWAVVAIAVYPIGLLIGCAVLLLLAWSAVLNEQPTRLSKAIAFLHSEYSAQCSNDARILSLLRSLSLFSLVPLVPLFSFLSPLSSPGIL